MVRLEGREILRITLGGMDYGAQQRGFVILTESFWHENETMALLKCKTTRVFLLDLFTTCGQPRTLPSLFFVS